MKKYLASTAILLPLLSGGCTTAQEIAPVPVNPGTSAFGDFLIGQFAVRHQQMGVAADHLSAVHEDLLHETEKSSGLEQQLFTILASEGRVDEAAALIDSLPGEQLLPQIVLISQEIAKKQYDSAHEKAAAMTSKGLGGFIKPLLLAWTSLSSQDISAAQKALAPLGAQKGLEALYHLHSGLLYQYAKMPKEAEEEFANAAKGPAGMTFRLAELTCSLLVKQGRQEDAQAIINTYLAAHPDSLYIQALLDEIESGALASQPDLSIEDGVAETLFGMASSLKSQSSRTVGLIMGRMALHIKPDFPLAQILVAEILEADQRYNDANSIYAAIPKKSPYSWSARLRLSLNLDDLDKTDEAVRILRDMIRQHPDRLEASITLGDILRHRERYGEAYDAYQVVLKQIGDTPQSHNWNLYYATGITLERQNRWDKAEPYFLKALELNPKQPLVLNYLGYTWIEKGMHMDRARQMIEEAVAQRPRDGFIVDSLGWVLFLLGDYEKAVLQLERAVELEPSDPVINDHLGDAYWKVGRNREARFQWRRAKSLDPAADELAMIENKLKRGLVSLP